MFSRYFGGFCFVFNKFHVFTINLGAREVQDGSSGFQLFLLYAF